MPETTGFGSWNGEKRCLSLPRLVSICGPILWIRSRMSVRTYVCTYIQYLKIGSFFWKISRKNLVRPEMGQKFLGANAPKMDPFAIYSKLWHYFFLQMFLNDKAWCLLTFGENHMSGKIWFLRYAGKRGCLTPLRLIFFKKIVFLFILFFLHL